MKRLLQGIFSVKNKKTHKVYSILGIKIKIKNKIKVEILMLSNRLEKIEREYHIQLFSFYNGNHFIKCNSLEEAFVRQINLDDFYKICCRYFCLRELSEYRPYEILIYISSCLDINEIDKAKELLMNYVNLHGTFDIYRFLPVAKFAKEQGITDENIEKAVFVFEKLEKSRKEKLFEKVIKGKSVAIVGNGPSEIGKGKGTEIDSHDIVIRFNNYKTIGFEKDYGSKTDIWIKCSSNDIKHNIRDKNIQLIVYEPDYKRHRIIDGYLDAMFAENISMDYFNFEDHGVLRKKLNIFPSTGLVAINKIISKCNVKKLDLYGFSFLQEIQDGYATHYFNDRSKEEAIKRSSHHSFNKETCYLRNLLLQEKCNDL
jgi:hypothetical protein